jgi:hypothetical protein
MYTTYSIDDGHGNQITTGLVDHLAHRIAQRMADERNEVLYLHSSEDDENDEPEPIEPTEIQITLDGPNGPRVVYGAQDAETVEAEIPEGWSVDWSSQIDLTATGTHSIRYAAPLVRRVSVEYQDRLVVLRPDASTDHEDVEDWYDGLGYSAGWYSEDGRDQGEVTHPVCTIEQLDGLRDAEIVAAECPAGASDEERAAYESAVEYARTALDAARGCVEALERAVVAYEDGDLRGVIDALVEAGRIEDDYGDDPATSALGRALLVEVAS